MHTCATASRPLLAGRRGVVVWAVALALLAGGATAAELERTFTFASDELEIVDMIGAVTVTAAAGDEFVVTVQIRGKDADAGLLEFDVDDGRVARLGIRFPLDEHDRYVYPELSSDKTTISFREGSDDPSWLRKVFRSGEQITVRRSGKGLELWVDVSVEVPAGAGLKVRHGVGAIDAAGVAADLDLDTHVGAISVRDGRGDLRADTGSGSVTVAAMHGDLDIDTGSGAVELADVAGERVRVDTGSGSVEATAVTCTKLLIDTGSGRVDAREISADAADIDTGSGGVRLDLARMGGGRFVVDTGSGGIELRLPRDASASLKADTGSGSIHVDLDGATIEHKERDELVLTVGDGDAHVVLDAGSGSITVGSR